MQGTFDKDALVGTAWLSERLGDPHVRVVEVSVNAKAYDEGHIPGAVLWNVYADLKDASFRLKDKVELEKLMSESGIDEATEVVFYGYAPAFGFWLMKLYGHARARMLDANRETWQAEGRPWTREPVDFPPTEYRLPDEDDRLRASQPLVERAIGDTMHVLADVRTQAEYRGERFWPSGGMEDGGRAGHVPGARHVPIDGLYDARGAFRAESDLRAIYRTVTPAREETVIPYCTVGCRAATTWFVLTYLLGQDRVRVYDGSWAEWGRLPNTPVESHASEPSA